MEEIRTFAASGVTLDEVTTQIQHKAMIGPDLIKYIADTKVTA
jgi:hypothetical protein